MNNDTREGLYLRDRSVMTPAQRRRWTKRQHQAAAPIKRSTIRKARRDVLFADAKRRLTIRLAFRKPSAQGGGIATPRAGKAVHATRGGGK